MHSNDMQSELKPYASRRCVWVSDVIEVEVLYLDWGRNATGELIGCCVEKYNQIL